MRLVSDVIQRLADQHCPGQALSSRQLFAKSGTNRSRHAAFNAFRPAGPIPLWTQVRLFGLGDVGGT
jgi:hypothetical protein